MLHSLMFQIYGFLSISLVNILFARIQSEYWIQLV